MRWFTDAAIRLGLSANAVSVLSVVFATLSAAAMLLAPVEPAWQRIVFWVAAAFFIECRAFCNLLDGMVAVKTQTASSVGEIYKYLIEFRILRCLWDLVLLPGIPR